MTVYPVTVDAGTPMGATLVEGGATFRVWAPRAMQVHVVHGATGELQDALAPLGAQGHWAGLVPGIADGSTYRFRVVGTDGTAALKRDPWAVELEAGVGLADQRCVVRDLTDYPWHDAGFAAPARPDLVVYQLHVGVFSAVDAAGHDIRDGRVATLLDALARVPYLADLGVNAVQPLPIVEFHGEWSLGYNGTDLFAPETDYCVADADLAPHLDQVNALLAQRGQTPLLRVDLVGHVNQLKAFVDVCHVFGIAVILDVVYNHAGGGLDDASLDHLDMPPDPDEGNSLYFSRATWAGGKVFAFDRAGVRDFLVGNATTFLDVFHADGLRFDEITVIDRNGGWSFCQDLTATLRSRMPRAVLIAEYWGDERRLGVTPAPDGMGFDLGYDDGLRVGVRAVLAQVAGGAEAPVDLDPIARGLARPWGFPTAWAAYTCLENHDLVLERDGLEREGGSNDPRIARLCGGDDSRSWWARSRARVATGLLLTAPGTPMLFMGQEFLEDKTWSDDVRLPGHTIWWDGVEGADPVMVDFHRATRDLVRLRRRQPALRADPVVVYPLARDARVLAFQRWVPGVGRDVVVVASFAETTFTGYALGFPRGGTWREVFNSAAYEAGPDIPGNGGMIVADGPGMHDMPASAQVTVPANALLVFALDDGDPIPP